MRAQSRALALVFCVLFVGAFTGCSDDDPVDATITIDNQSSFFLDELYIAPIDTVTWGPNLLGTAGLAPDEFITVAVDCDFYDVRIIDELGAECIIVDVDLCGFDDLWVIDDVFLNSCTF